MIPGGDRSHLATNCGLLFNELLKSPKGIMDALLSVLKLGTASLKEHAGYCLFKSIYI